MSRGLRRAGATIRTYRYAGATQPSRWAASVGNGLNEPTASLPVTIYNYAVSPYEEWHRQAWAAALVLLLLVLLLNITARLLVRSRVGAR